jgi:hypothetical protein
MVATARRPADRTSAIADWLLRTDSVFDHTAVRVLLSAIILVSVMPLEAVERLRTGFLLLFATELSVRAGIFVARWRVRGERSVAEVLFLGLDLLATLSFLPYDVLSELGVDTSVLRLVRAARMLLLLAYWGPYFRDFFQIALRRERVYQFALVGVFALLLSATGAAALRLFDLRHVDTNSNGIAGEPADWELVNVLWWSFRQVQDPGNLLGDTADEGVLVVSLVLTSGGMLLVAFLIGIGASLVEELFRAGRYRPTAMRGHTVILNAGPESLGVLTEISSYYRKQVSRPRMLVMGATADRPDFLNQPSVRRFRYLPGRATDLADLARASVASARRVVVLAEGPGQEADAATVTVTLAVRRPVAQHDPFAEGGGTTVAAEINHPRNAELLTSEDGRTLPVLARRLTSLVLGQTAVSPGIEAALSELLSSEGSEIYTAVAGEGACPPPAVLPVRGPLAGDIAGAYTGNRVILLGILHASRSGRLVPLLNPPSCEGLEVRGLIGVADRFKSLRRQLEVAQSGLGGPAPAVGDGPPLVRVRVDDYPRRVLMLGFHDDAVETVEQLVRLCLPGLVLRVLVGTPRKRRRTVEALREQLGAGDLAVTTEPSDLLVHLPGGVSRIVVETRDRLQPGLYVNAVSDDERPDTVMLLRRDRPELDPDAATVLGVVRLMDAVTRAGRRDERLPHVVVEVADPEKVGLLQRQLEGHPLGHRTSLLCAETLRQRILAQSFFVPALTDLYRELLTAGQQELLTLEPLTQVSFERLLGELPARHGLIPLGVAFARDGGACGLEVVVNPPPGFEPPGRIERIYAVGSSDHRVQAQQAMLSAGASRRATAR